MIKNLDNLSRNISIIGGTTFVLGILLLGLGGYLALASSGVGLLGAAIIVAIGAGVGDRGLRIYLYGGLPLPLSLAKDASQRKPGPWHEQDGGWSMRRIAASFLFLAAVALLGIGAATDHQYAFWGGLAAMLGGTLLLFFTTWADLSGLASAVVQRPSYGVSASAWVPPAGSTHVASASNTVAVDLSQHVPPPDPSAGGMP